MIVNHMKSWRTTSMSEASSLLTTDATSRQEPSKLVIFGKFEPFEPYIVQIHMFRKALQLSSPDACPMPASCQAESSLRMYSFPRNLGERIVEPTSSLSFCFCVSLSQSFAWILQSRLSYYHFLHSPLSALVKTLQNGVNKAETS